jgi:hypothetical protein
MTKIEQHKLSEGQLKDTIAALKLQSGVLREQAAAIEAVEKNMIRLRAQGAFATGTPLRPASGSVATSSMAAEEAAALSGAEDSGAGNDCDDDGAIETPNDHSGDSVPSSRGRGRGGRSNKGRQGKPGNKEKQGDGDSGSVSGVRSSRRVSVETDGDAESAEDTQDPANLRAQRVTRAKADTASPSSVSRRRQSRGVGDATVTTAVATAVTTAVASDNKTRGRRGLPLDGTGEANPKGSPRKKKRGRKRSAEDADDADEADDVGPTNSEMTKPFQYPDLDAEPTPTGVDGYSSGEEDAADTRAQRAWKSAVMHVWKQISEHKNALIFKERVTNEDAKGYEETVLRPMDLGTIKKNIETGVLTGTREFEHAVMLMYANALVYNKDDSFIYEAAEEMRKDSVQRIDDFRMIMTSRREKEPTAETPRDRRTKDTPKSRRRK